MTDLLVTFDLTGYTAIFSHIRQKWTILKAQPQAGSMDRAPG